MRQGEMVNGGGSFRLSRAEIVDEGLDLKAKEKDRRYKTELKKKDT